jgi:hypothetical protein
MGTFLEPEFSCETYGAKSIPAHAEIGMKILGPFLSVEDPETLFFMRGLPDLASREPMKAKFYEGHLWKREPEKIRPVGRLLASQSERQQRERARKTTASPRSNPASASTGRPTTRWMQHDPSHSLTYLLDG